MQFKFIKLDDGRTSDKNIESPVEYQAVHYTHGKQSNIMPHKIIDAVRPTHSQVDCVHFTLFVHC